MSKAPKPQSRTGGLRWILLWVLGVPFPVVLLLYLLRSRS